MSTTTTARPAFPFIDGCRHLGACANVYAGRACALDTNLENDYDEAGRAIVRWLTDDPDLGIAAGSEMLAVDPYTGAPSGLCGVAAASWRRAEADYDETEPSTDTCPLHGADCPTWELLGADA